MKIPDPRVAKKLTLTGQRRIAEEEEARIKLAADETQKRKRLRRAWTVQSRKLVDQAMSPKKFMQVASVAFPLQLIDLGFEIVEIGDITTHYYGELPKAQIIQDLRGLKKRMIHIGLSGRRKDIKDPFEKIVFEKYEENNEIFINIYGAGVLVPGVYQIKVLEKLVFYLEELLEGKK
jgi:hypothetical protein